MKWGFLDAAGQYAIPAQFDEVAAFSEGLAAVRLGDRWGYVDPAGEVVVPVELLFAGRFVHGMANARRSEAIGAFIDRTGQELPYQERTSPPLQQHDVFAVGGNPSSSRASERRWGVIATDSLEVVLPLKWAKITDLGAHYWACIDPATRTTTIVDRSGTTMAHLPIRWLTAYAAGAFFVFNVHDTIRRLVVVDDSFAIARTFESERRMSLGFDNPSQCYRLLDGSRTHWFDASLQEIDEPPRADAPATADSPEIRTVKRKKHVLFDDELSPLGPFDAAHRAKLADGTAIHVWAMVNNGKRKLWGLLGSSGWLIEPVHELFEADGAHWRLGRIGCEGLVNGLGQWLLEPVHTRTRSCGRDTYAFYEGGKAFKNGSIKGGSWNIVAADGSPFTEESFAAVGVWSEERLAVATAE